ncbi:MAG: glucose-6-phosphate isomerase [Hyphomicrobiaceae bacterium]
MEDATGQANADTLLLQQRVDGCLDKAIGAAGLRQSELDAWLDRLQPALAGLKADYAGGKLPLLRVPEATDDIVACEAAMARLSEDAQTIVFFGTGGSSLGGQALAQLTGWNIPGGADAGQRARPRTRFYDNLDGLTLERALASFDLSRTRFVVVSKSGGTPETMVQAVCALQAVTAAGLEQQIPRLFLGVTEPAQPGKTNALRSLFEGYDIPLLEHHTGIGGRFSGLTNVGLLPALSRGIDVRALRGGAKTVVDALLAAKHPRDFAPAIGAATAIGLNRDRGIRVMVMMPYADRLGKLSEWYVQLWAESLGKDGEGTAPIPCLGPLDQHSQLQLFMDGPKEHCITVVRGPIAGTGPRLDPELCEKAGLAFMSGRAVGDLVAAQAQAVPEALLRAGRPVRTFDLARLDERTLGALMMHLMLETILAGRLLGVDPFDQPAVELSKVITRERLTRA